MFTIVDIVIALALIFLILIQEREVGSSGLFGGTSGDTPYQTRRGFERALFWATVILAILFAGVSIAKLMVAA